MLAVVWRMSLARNEEQTSGRPNKAGDALEALSKMTQAPLLLQRSCLPLANYPF